MRASTAMMIASSAWLVFSPACGGSILLGDNEDPTLAGDAGRPPPRRGRARTDAGSPFFGGDVGPIPDASVSRDSSGAGDDTDASIPDASIPDASITDASIDDATASADAMVAPVEHVTLSSSGGVDGRIMMSPK